MTLLANNDVYAARICCTLGVQTSINVLHYLVSSVVGAPTDTHMVTALDLAFAGAIKALMGPDASYRGIGVQRRLPTPATNQEFGIAGQGAGTLAGPSLPKQLSGLVTKRTAFAGKRYRGRFYAPFPSEASNDGAEGRPIAAYVTALTNLGGVIDNALGIGAGGDSATITPGLFNKTTGAFTPITSCTARNYWANQRRRGDFGPTNSSPI